MIGLPPVIQTKISPREGGDDLRDYILLLWSRRWLLAGSALAAAAAAFAISVSSPRLWESDLVIAVGQSKLNENAAGQINPANVRPIIYNSGIARQVVNEFKLSDPPDRLDASKFLQRALFVDEVRNTDLIRVRVRLRDPERAAKVANAVANKSIELARELSQREAVQVRDDIKTQLDEARSRMEQAAEALSGYRKRAQLELLKSDLEGRLDERRLLVALDAEIAERRGELARAEAETGKHERLHVLTRTIDSAPALAESARKQNAGDVLGLQLKEEQINTVRETLEAQVARLRTELSGLEQKRRQLAQDRSIGSGDSAALKRFYDHDAEISRLEMERDLTRKIYTEVAAQHENSRLKVASRSAQLQSIDRAYAPTTPLPRHTVRNTIGGFSLGVMLAASYVLLAAIVGKREEAS